MIPWLDRRFDFDFPVDLYPEILARFRGTPARLEDAVRGLSREQLLARPNGKWSIQENAGHLLDEEDLFRTRVNNYLAGCDALTAAPYQQRELPYNEWQLEEILKSFRDTRELEVRRLLALPADYFSRTAWHPRLKLPMRLVDHLLFFAEHDDHHLARICEIRTACR